MSLRTNLSLAIPIAEGQTYSRLNLGESTITKFQDDTGHDFLASGKGYLAAESYESFDSYNSRVDFNLSFEGTPAKGARELTLEGVFILEVEKEGSEEVNTKLKMPGDNASIVTATDHGSMEIWNDGEASTDTDTYTIFRIASDLPVKSISVVGGDDTEEANALGVGIEANQFVFKNQPEEIEVKITFGQIEKLEIPLDLTFGIGF
ncbi:hypothetical protein [Robiginitalea sp.]|uniref:hypothetical protein n=1 Tax=Robiginitalea sp. TaxID=1902411 RepID=UPI003C70A65D